MSFYEKKDFGYLIKIKVVTNAKENKIIKEDDILKVKLKALPIEGRANKELIGFFSKTFKIPKSSIKIIKGKSSKLKQLALYTSDVIDFDSC